MPRVSGFFAVQVMINDEALLVEPLTFTSDLDLGAGMGVGVIFYSDTNPQSLRLTYQSCEQTQPFLRLLLL